MLLQGNFYEAKDDICVRTHFYSVSFERMFGLLFILKFLDTSLDSFPRKTESTVHVFEIFWNIYELCNILISCRSYF